MSVPKLAVTKAFSNQARGGVFFLHGSCDTGAGLKKWVRRILGKDFQFENFDVLYPTAMSKPYKLLDGKDSSVWFDRISFHPNDPEDQNNIKKSAAYLTEIVQNQLKNCPGTEASKIIIGGFSMGGQMALHMGYRILPQIAGVFALSSVLPDDSKVYEVLESSHAIEMKEKEKQNKNITNFILKKPTTSVPTRHLPNLFMSHSFNDPLVKYKWARDTFGKLREFGVPGQFHTIDGPSHDINKTQLYQLQSWIKDILDPPAPTNNQNKKRSYHINDNIAVPLLYQ